MDSDSLPIVADNGLFSDSDGDLIQFFRGRIDALSSFSSTEQGIFLDWEEEVSGNPGERLLCPPLPRHTLQTRQLPQLPPKGRGRSLAQIPNKDRNEPALSGYGQSATPDIPYPQPPAPSPLHQFVGGQRYPQHSLSPWNGNKPPSLHLQPTRVGYEPFFHPLLLPLAGTMRHPSYVNEASAQSSIQPPSMEEFLSPPRPPFMMPRPVLPICEKPLGPRGRGRLAERRDVLPWEETLKREGGFLSEKPLGPRGRGRLAERRDVLPWKESPRIEGGLLSEKAVGPRGRGRLTERSKQKSTYLTTDSPNETGVAHSVLSEVRLTNTSPRDPAYNSRKSRAWEIESSTPALSSEMFPLLGKGRGRALIL